jgi:hypothetical protein
MVAKKTNPILRPGGKSSHVLAPEVRFAVRQWIDFALAVFRTYKRLFKRSLRLTITAIPQFKGPITTSPAWHMLCANSFLSGLTNPRYSTHSATIMLAHRFEPNVSGFRLRHSTHVKSWRVVSPLKEAAQAKGTASHRSGRSGPVASTLAL